MIAEKLGTRSLKKFRPIASDGFIWLMLQAGVILVYLRWSGRLTLRHDSDTNSYLVVAGLTSVTAWLESLRTFGYPAFLRVTAILSPDYALIPIIHFVLHVIAVIIFMWALKIYGFSERQSLVGASPLLYVEAIINNVQYLLTDSLAVSSAVVTTSLLLAISVRKSSIRLWLYFGVMCFLTYQIRPAYLFLIPLLPLLGVAFLWHRKEASEWVHVKNLVARALIACLLPYLAFCTIRWVAVGDFALVSFSGWVQTGTTGQMLDNSLVEDLPEDLKDLGRGIVEQRKKNRDVVSSGDSEEINRLVEDLSFEFGTFRTVPNRADFLNDAIGCADPIGPDGAFSFHTWNRCFNYNCITLAMGTAVKLYGTNLTTLNEKLGSLSRAIIVERPLLFIKWMAKSFVTGTYRCFLGTYGASWLKTPFNLPVFMLVLLLVFSDLVLIIRIIYFKQCRNGFEIRFHQDEGWERLFTLFLIIAILYYFAGMFLVILVQPPILRYVWPTAIFAPSALAAVLLWKWNALRVIKLAT